MHVTEQQLVTSHLIGYDEHDVIIDLTTRQPFMVDAYSRMKYGDRLATRQFAVGLAQQLIDNAPEFVEDDRPPELLVAYKAVPPACFYLSRYCLDVVNEVRADNRHEPGRIIHVYKDRVTATNYAAASQDERAQELASIGFSLEGRTIIDKNIAILDDVRITGASERRITHTLKMELPKTLMLGYVAVFDPEQASLRPSVEQDLNSGTIKTIEDLLPLIQADNFDLNIRTLKLLLGSPQGMLQEFLGQCPVELVNTILRGALDTGTDFLDSYRPGFLVVREASS